MESKKTDRADTHRERDVWSDLSIFMALPAFVIYAGVVFIIAITVAAGASGGVDLQNEAKTILVAIVPYFADKIISSPGPSAIAVGLIMSMAFNIIWVSVSDFLNERERHERKKLYIMLSSGVLLGIILVYDFL